MFDVICIQSSHEPISFTHRDDFCLSLLLAKKVSLHSRTISIMISSQTKICEQKIIAISMNEIENYATALRTHTTLTIICM